MKTAQEAYQNYQERYLETSINPEHLTHDSLAPLIKSLKELPEFNISLIGHSVEGREVNLIKFGSGPTRIFLWSQMHGDEPTATMALFDLFNFLADDTSLGYILGEQLSIYFIPMVNPDGAERNSRYNAWGVDINRDARLPQTPEGKLLKGTAEIIHPHYAFNLHDQHRYHSAGYTDKPATISFLAPPQDHAYSITPNREKAMQLIVAMNQAIQAEIPGHVGRYVAHFDQTSFGDTFQFMDFATILIESGGYWGDPYRQVARKMNFLAILSALEIIAKDEVNHFDKDPYFEIPEHREDLHDVILRHVTIKMGKETAMVDIAINWEEHKHGNKHYFEGKVINFGDLSMYTAYEEHDCRGMILQAGKAQELDNNPDQYWDYLQKGVTHLQVDIDTLPRTPYTKGMLNLQPLDSDSHFPLKREGGANFTLWKDGKAQLAVVNGFVANLMDKSIKSPSMQGLVIR